MTLAKIESLWKTCLSNILDYKLPSSFMKGLAKQTLDSIRRVQVYRNYGDRAKRADDKNLPYYYSSNPLVLSQRTTLSREDRIWNLYLATYFGKHHKSKWLLYKRVAFDQQNKLTRVATIQEDRDAYYEIIENKNVFDNCYFSNHRKYTKKTILDHNGFANSANQFLDKINDFAIDEVSDFDSFYLLSKTIPSFGRMAAFDFTCSLVKCNFPVKEPTSLYLKDSTGPKAGFMFLLGLLIDNPSSSDSIVLGDEILEWFINNSEIYMVAQVLEDSVCNWQKNPEATVTYYG